MSTPHRWKLFRAGGVDQVSLRRGADLQHLDELDDKLWVALAMPVKGVQLDKRTLELIDGDKDGRVRAPEVRAAVRFAVENLKDADDLFKPELAGKLSRWKDGDLLAGAKRILSNLGKKDADTISLEDVRDTAKIFAATRFNGDGVVPPEAAEDEATRKVLDEIVATHGSKDDRSGKPGVDQARVDAFFGELKAYLAWYDTGVGQAAEGKAAAGGSEILPIGEATANAAQAVSIVRAKLDDFFTRCRLAAFDAVSLNPTAADLAALSSKELAPDAPEVARLPIAKIEPGRALALSDGINPAWTAAVAKLKSAAIEPILGSKKNQLSEPDWETLKQRLSAYEKWQSEKPATTVEKLGLERLRQIAASDATAKVDGLIAEDVKLEKESAQIEAVEKLILFQRDLPRVLDNFVNFSEFYARKGAVFQAGSLFLDGRACHLCIEVADPGKHAVLASLSGTCLAYCDCVRGPEKMSIVAAITNGDAANLVVGRNGIFYDRQGRDFDATITKIVANPISVREAFWSPYKKFFRMIEEQVQKRAAAAEADSTAKLQTAAASTAHADKTKLPEAKKIDVGTVAAIGVAIGGIGAMVTGILTAFFGLGFWMPLGIVALILMISGPSMLLAWLKLRQRNLGPILDANGWAVNALTRINVPFGAALTDLAAVPRGAERSFVDPFAEKKSRWRLWVVLLLIVAAAAAWYFGKLDEFLPEAAHSQKVLGTNHPDAPEPPAK